MSSLTLEDIEIGDRLVLTDDRFSHHRFFGCECVVSEFDRDKILVTFDGDTEKYNFYPKRFTRINETKFTLPDELFEL